MSIVVFPVLCSDEIMRNYCALPEETHRHGCEATNKGAIFEDLCKQMTGYNYSNGWCSR